MAAKKFGSLLFFFFFIIIVRPELSRSHSIARRLSVTLSFALALWLALVSYTPRAPFCNPRTLSLSHTPSLSLSLALSGSGSLRRTLVTRRFRLLCVRLGSSVLTRAVFDAGDVRMGSGNARQTLSDLSCEKSSQRYVREKKNRRREIRVPSPSGWHLVEVFRDLAKGDMRYVRLAEGDLRILLEFVYTAKLYTQIGS